MRWCSAAPCTSIATFSAHAPERLHEEISADYNDMIYAKTAKEIETRRKSFIRKWRLKCRAVADSLEEAGDRLFTFTRLPESQWDRHARPMRSSGCTRNSSGASRRRPCCRLQKPPPCFSGRCWLPVKSPCARWTDGRHFAESLHLNALILPHDAIISARRRRRYANFHKLRDTTTSSS